MGYYDQISGGYNELHKEEQLKKVKIILDKLKLKKADKLLDVGCGTGFYLDLFDCDVIGVDPSEKLLEQYGGNHQVILMRAENLDFPDDSFDIVMSITAIHNFEDIEKGLKEILRVGKDRFVFSVLKRSSNYKLIEGMINQLFAVDETIDEDKDLIFFCHKKDI
jgi:demethylmenaquinone methyltransferase/2-methoxy-6-polyprenyl-1,4-benzoquinol methylase